MAVSEFPTERTRWYALFSAVALLIPTTVSLTQAIRAERSGIVFYSSRYSEAAVYAPSLGIGLTLFVTRAESPEKFRRIVNLRWFYAMAYGSATLLFFSFYRRLGE